MAEGKAGMHWTAMQQTRHARRIYVGGIPDNTTTEQDLRDFFNDVLDKALDEPLERGAVVSVYINALRRFAFVELDSIELTTACINQLDGLPYRGTPLKIRRPIDYQPHLVPQSGLPIPHLTLTKIGIADKTASDKLFVGSIPYHLTEDQVKELLGAIGPLKSFHLMKNLQTGESKGFAFCEYMDNDLTRRACERLNGLQLGSNYLTVRIALNQIGLERGSNSVEANNAQPAAHVDARDVLSFLAGLKLGYSLGLADGAAEDQRRVYLGNLHLSLTDFDPREFLKEFGEVTQVILPRDGQGVSRGHAIITFSKPEEAKLVLNSMQGFMLLDRPLQVGPA